MSACFRLVLESVCRSNHHRLAVMALGHLEGETANAWRSLFLKYRNVYLEGAKAPDDLFKDFKNHVLHVRDGDWGGAREAAREWYRRTVRALTAKDWRHAAWCAGVMSHYVVDPLQPFHTGQSEEEGVIHRAVEWSLSKAFPELLAIIETELGWPDVAVPPGEDWLEKMIRTGAVIANKHYETLIDHYDFEAGARRPVAGLDQEMKDVVAALIAYASVMLSRVLQRAVAEADIAPPKAGLVLDQACIVLATPVRALARMAEDAAERSVVCAQHAEFRRTGKVRRTLSEDDRAVRALYAEEVLKTSLSSLDCLWPRETGTKAGQGAEPRLTPRRKRKGLFGPPDLAASSQAAPPPPPPAERPRKAKPHRPRIVKRTLEASSASAPQADASLANAPAPEEAAVMLTPAEASRPRARLTREALIVDAPSIGPKTAGRLNLIGVKTVGDLLEVSPEDAADRIRQGHINAKAIRDWQAQALLACTVPDLTALAAQVLVGAGVSSVEDLASADLNFLMDAIDLFLASPEGERILRGQDRPDRERVLEWIEAARDVCESRTAA